MAIIDRNAVFFEGSLTANATGNTVALTACKLPGRMEPMPLRLSVTEAFLPAEVQNLSIDMEQAAQPTAPGPACGRQRQHCPQRGGPHSGSGRAALPALFAPGRAPALPASAFFPHARIRAEREPGPHLRRPDQRRRPALRSGPHGPLSAHLWGEKGTDVSPFPLPPAALSRCPGLRKPFFRSVA